MKKAIAIIVAVLFVFALTSISFAAEKVKQVTGEVKAVDAVAKTITVAKKVKDKVEETVITVDDKTKIILDKETKTLADVKVGDKVTVKYTEANGKRVAKSVVIKTAEKK